MVSTSAMMLTTIVIVLLGVRLLETTVPDCTKWAIQQKISCFYSEKDLLFNFFVCRLIIVYKGKWFVTAKHLLQYKKMEKLMTPCNITESQLDTNVHACTPANVKWVAHGIRVPEHWLVVSRGSYVGDTRAQVSAVSHPARSCMPSCFHQVFTSQSVLGHLCGPQNCNQLLAQAFCWKE